MTSSIGQSHKSLPEQANEPGDLDSQITDVRQQIATLQGELKELKQRQRDIKRQQALQTRTASISPADKPAHHLSESSEGRSVHLLLQRNELLVLGLLVLFAFVLRVYRLGTFPDTVLADEADNAQSAVQILYGRSPENGFFGFDWTPQPAFSIYKEATFISIFGFNIMAMRLPSAIFSTLALIPFYLLLRRQLTIISSFSASILLATSVWYLNFSRSGWNNIDICFYMLMAMLFLMWGHDAINSANHPRWLKWVYFAGAGFFCALGLYGYPAGRAITLAVAAFFPVAWLFHRPHFKNILLGYIVLFGVEAATFAPEGIYAAKNWEFFNGRSKVVIIFNNPDYKADPIGTMLQQLNRNIRGPWDGRVNNTAQYSPIGEPQLDGVTGLLALAGMALTLILGMLRRRSETRLWWLMLLAGWGLTQLITVGTPNGARGIGYMPTLVYFAGVGIEGIVLILHHTATKLNRFPILRPLSFATLSVTLLLAAYANIMHYIEWQSLPHTRQDRYLYVTAREFPDWSADIVDRARNKRGTSNVGQWRDAHPIQDIANPYSSSP
jgi:4-amino-4-deoxy-L-arabinose transferase-like glycosyltransferase